MYSHELQTCDWPRNVGCDVSDSVAREQKQDKLHGQGQQQTLQKQQTQQQTNVPSRIRFGSAFTGPQSQQQSLKATAPPPQYHRQPSQVIQAQVHNIPPPPQLKVSPNPIITSRGQPKHVLEAQEEIAKVSGKNLNERKTRKIFLLLLLYSSTPMLWRLYLLSKKRKPIASNVFIEVNRVQSAKCNVIVMASFISQI